MALVVDITAMSSFSNRSHILSDEQILGFILIILYIEEVKCSTDDGVWAEF